MTTYRFYLLDKDGSAVGPPHCARCQDDHAALMYAWQFSAGIAVEIMADDLRRIAVLPADTSGRSLRS